MTWVDADGSLACVVVLRTHHEASVLGLMAAQARRASPLHVGLHGSRTLAYHARRIAVCVPWIYAGVLILGAIEQVAILVAIVIARWKERDSVHAQMIGAATVVSIVAASNEAFIERERVIRAGA